MTPQQLKLYRKLSERLSERCKQENIPISRAAGSRFIIMPSSMYGEGDSWTSELTEDNVQDFEERFVKSMKLMEGWNRPEAKMAQCKHGNVPGECRPCVMEKL